jgi:predicted regulator of Ras-like GTPase activity (Roadblock/LC7/MglB family)
VRTDVDSVISDTLTIKGVVAVALIDASGDLRASEAREGPGFAEAGPLVAAALAASRVIGDFVGGDLRQTVIEYRDGPVVLAPLPAASGDGAAPSGAVVALRLASLADLGRVRFALPRLLARFAAAT